MFVVQQNADFDGCFCLSLALDGLVRDRVFVEEW